MKASTPCWHCHAEIEVEVHSREDLDRAMKEAGAIWDRGWFCNAECRDMFDTYAPRDGWDRAKVALRPKVSG